MNDQTEAASKVRPASEAFPVHEVEEPSVKRVKLEAKEEVADAEVDDCKLSPRKSRKPAHPLHRVTDPESVPGSPQSRMVFGMEDGAEHKPSLIQRLVKHAASYQPGLSFPRSEQDLVEFSGKVEDTGEEDLRQLDSSIPHSPSPSNDNRVDERQADFGALHNVADAALVLLSQKNEASDIVDRNVLQSLESGDHNLAALIAASEGLLSMKTMAEEVASEQDEGEPLDDEVEAYPAPTLPRPMKPSWAWSYVSQPDSAEPLPSWSCRRNRTDARVDLILKNGPEDFYKEKDAKIRRQDNMLKERDRQIAKLQLQLKSEKKQREKRISELELELKKQQLLEKQQEEDLSKLRAEVASKKEEVRHQQSQIKLLKQELAQVHRRESDAAAAASDVQEELHKLQSEANVANNYKQELIKYEAEAAKHQREADRHAAEVRSLQRTVKSQAKERDGLLQKLTEMAEQVSLFASLKERTCKMERIFTEITRRSDELRTSCKEADLEAFHTLKEIVAESVKLGVNGTDGAAATGGSLLDFLAGDGDKGRDSKEAAASELAAKEEEIQSLKHKCQSYAETVNTLEQQLQELSKSSSSLAKPGAWKARVPGGQTGEYHTYRMRSNAQVELPEGTLLSVPRSANMQSSSNSLLTKVHEGDLLNFMEVDMSSLSPAELGVATRQLLAMDMGALHAPDLSALLKKLGQVDISPVSREDVRGLAVKLLNVLGVDESIALFEYVNLPQNTLMGHTKLRTPHKPDMNDRMPTDASPKLYTNQMPNRRPNLSMPTSSASSRRDLNNAPMQPGSARSLASHHMSNTHHVTMGGGGTDGRGRDHDSRDLLNQRSLMSRQGNSRSGASDIQNQLAAQAMMGSAPLQFSSAMLTTGSQQSSGQNMPKNVMRRAPANGVAITGNPGTLTHAQLASLVTGGGSPNVLSIPINQLNQLTQLGGMPVIVPGLGQLVHMPQNTVVQKPR